MKSNCTSHPTFFRKFFIHSALIAALFLIGWGTGLSQRTITGTVYDAEFNEPLIGANVFVKGAQIGTVTDFDGNFDLEVPDSAQILVFSYTGYQSQEIAIGDQSEFTVSMSAGELLDEVVVIGYGTVKRDDATGAIQSVTTKDFNKGK